MNGNLRVANIRTESIGYRCDRSSPLGNPFKLENKTLENRIEVVQAHKRFLESMLLNKSIEEKLDPSYKQVSRYEYLDTLGKAFRDPSKTLLCWCYPQKCHCDNYIEFYNSIRLVISGSRSINNKQFFNRLDNILSRINKENKYLIGGECRTGVDSFLQEYANTRNWKYIPIEAQWNKGRGAGYARNKVMLNLASHFIAVWDGKSKGTKDAINTANSLNLTRRIIKYDVHIL